MKRLLAVTFMALLFSGVALADMPHQVATPTPTRTPTRTPIPTYTPTPTPIPYNATATPHPTATPGGVHDPNFMQSGYDSPWIKTGTVTWTFGRMTLGPGASISQHVVNITGTHNISYSIMAGATTTTSVQIDFGGVITTALVTHRVPRVFADAISVTFPLTLALTNAGSEPLVLSYVSWDRIQEFGILAETDPGTGGATPLGIGGFMDWFEPYTLGDVPEIQPLFEGISWREFGVRPGMKVFATILMMVTPRLMPQYIISRLLLIVVAWIMGFVLDRISKSKPMVTAVVQNELPTASAWYGSYRRYSGISRSFSRRGGGRRRSKKGW
jgi:hypothetical protein